MEDTDRFETWLSACPSVIYVLRVESDGFVPVWASPNIEHILGYPRSDMLSNLSWWADHLHPDDRDSVLSGVGKLFEDGHLVHQYRFEHADGTYRYVRDELRLTSDEHGDLTQVVGSWSDITDTKRAENLAEKLALEVVEREKTEQKLRLSEEVYRDLVEGSLEGIGIISREGKPLFANHALVRILGFDTVAEVQALDSFEELAAPHERQRLRDYMAARSSGREVPDTYEYEGRRKDGTPIWLENTVRVIEWNGELCLQGTLIDVTDRKQWQAKLEESEERYRLLVDQAPDAIFINCEGKLVFANAAACDLFKARQVSDIVNKEAADFIHPDDLDEVARRIRLLRRRGGKLALLEGRFICLDGSVVEVELSGTGITWQGQRAVQIVGRDITLRKRAAEVLREREEQLAQMRQLATMGEMASGLAHQLGQPLNAATNYANGCLRRLPEAFDDDENSFASGLTHVCKELDRAGRIVRGIASFIKTSEPQRDAVDLNEIVRRAMDRVRSEASEHGVKISHRLSRSLPPILADDIQIEEVILNLMHNSIDAMADMNPKLARKLVVSTRPGAPGEVLATVSDSGMMAEEPELDLLFEPFHSTKSNGMGMGLAISRTIIELHDGRIFAARNPGHGMKFSFALPTVPSST